MTDLILILLFVLIAGVLLWREWKHNSALRNQGPPVKNGRNGTRSYYWKLVRQAGYSPNEIWPFYVGVKIALALLLPLLAMEFLGLIWTAVLFGIMGFFVPDAVLAYLRRKRKAAIVRALPFFLDLLVALLQAGMSLEEAFKRTAREGLRKNQPLRDEVALIVEEMSFGQDRSVGFHCLADRTGVRELKGLASALALGSGASIETTLRAQADLARAKRREDGTRRLELANAEVLLPLMLCGFPVFVVFVLAPMGILLLESLQTLGRVIR